MKMAWRMRTASAIVLALLASAGARRRRKAPACRSGSAIPRAPGS